MQKADKIVDEMEALLDKLVESAQKLLELSKHEIDEDELNRLQEEQEMLLTALVQKDEDFHQLPKAAQEKQMPRRIEIDEKINHFQELNANFVENINAAHGLIKFGETPAKKNSNLSA